MPAALRTRLRPPSQPTRYCCPQRLAVGERDVDAAVVLREAGHITSAMDRHRQLTDPLGQDALDVVLPQPENVVVPGGEVADVQGYVEVHDLMHLSLREESIGDAALVEDLDGACVQTAGARAGEVLAGAPLDNGDVDARQRQLARQHQPGRTSPGDHHRMVGLRRSSDFALRANRSSTPMHSFRDPADCGFGRRFYGMRRGLKQARCGLHIRVGKGRILVTGYFRDSAERCGNG